MRAGMNQYEEALAQPALPLCLIESHSEPQKLRCCAESELRKNSPPSIRMQVTHPDVSFKRLKQREDVCANKITQRRSALRRRWLIVPRGCFSQIFSVIDWALFNHAENIWHLSFWGQFTVTLSNSPASLPACFVVVFLAVNHIFIWITLHQIWI